eukprot:TRINITY_DN452_c0_g1_i1.p1 TRINITY_DN452_c0_g1~~TRINITY_DN452_c0_g1_i1.p1  ORF type:complete len:139 (+),score=43.49 TRINITY_DN452_c0_g1_i1:95-511(+)
MGNQNQINMQGAQIKREDVEITKDDQANINAFSKMNLRYHTISRELQTLQENIKNLEDALTEMELMDDTDVVRTKYGETCLVSLDLEQAKAGLEKILAQNKKDIAAFQTEVDEVKKKMNKLKATLYTKFGNSINLEEE